MVEILRETVCEIPDHMPVKTRVQRNRWKPNWSGGPGIYIYVVVILYPLNKGWARASISPLSVKDVIRFLDSDEERADISDPTSTVVSMAYRIQFDRMKVVQFSFYTTRGGKFHTRFREDHAWAVSAALKELIRTPEYRSALMRTVHQKRQMSKKTRKDEVETVTKRGMRVWRSDAIKRGRKQKK